MNREFLMLAHNFDPTKHGIGGWYVSEKLDGMRAYWDGGITRGIPASEVSFANTAKDHRLVEPPISTGLWSRYAKVIHAPDWWLDLLPLIPLDGELFLGRGQFQKLMSIVKQHNPDERWENVKYVIFDSPSDECMFQPGKINNPNCKLIIPSDLTKRPTNTVQFFKTYDWLSEQINTNTNLEVLNQLRLPGMTKQAEEYIASLLDHVTDLGGEGLIVRKPESIWTPKRSNDLLKIKKLLDSEGVVVGYTWGKGKLEGLMGAMIVKWGDKSFELSGFTDAERDLRYHVKGEPGSVAAINGVTNLRFPIGSKVTFRYTEVSNDGIPLKARYYRKNLS
jgi:DNA ligase-1